MRRALVEVAPDRWVRSDHVIAVERRMDPVHLDVFEVTVHFYVGDDHLRVSTTYSPRTHNQPRGASTRHLNKVRAAMDWSVR